MFKLTSCYIFIYIFVILLPIFSIFCPCKAEQLLETNAKGAKSHPIYSKYEIDKSNTIINFGIQPLWIPTNLICETMKRDLILKEKLHKYGMSINWYSFLKGDDVNLFFKNRSLDVGIAGDMPAISAASDIEIVIPSLTQQGFISIVAKEQMLISGLKGKRIGFAFGSNAHYALLSILEHANLKEEDVDLVALDVSEMPEALERGEIDAFSAWEPISSIAIKNSDNFVKIYKCLSSGYLYFNKEFAVKHRKAVKHIIAAEIRAIFWLQKFKKNILRACKWTIENSERFIGKKLNLTPNEIAKLANEDIIGMSSLPIIPENDLRENGSIYNEFKFLKKLRKISASVEWSKIYSSFDRDIIKEIVSNQREYNFTVFEYEDL